VTNQMSSREAFDYIVEDFTRYTPGERRERQVSNRLILVHAPTRYFVPELSTTDESKLRLYYLQIRNQIHYASSQILYRSDTTPIVAVLPANYEYPRPDKQTWSTLLNWGDRLGDYLLNNGSPRDWDTKYSVDLLSLNVPYKIVSGETAYTIQNMETEADSIRAMISELVDINNYEYLEIEQPENEFNVNEAPYICGWGLDAAIALEEYDSSDVIVVAYYPTALMLAAHVAVMLNAPLLDLSYFNRLEFPDDSKLHWMHQKLIDLLAPTTAIYIGLDDDIAVDIAEALRDAGIQQVDGLVESTFSDLVTMVASAEWRTWTFYGIWAVNQDMPGDFAALAAAYGLHLLAVSTRDVPDPYAAASRIQSAIGQTLPVIRTPYSVNEVWLIAIILARKYRGGEQISLPPIYYTAG